MRITPLKGRYIILLQYKKHTYFKFSPIQDAFQMQSESTSCDVGGAGYSLLHPGSTSLWRTLVNYSFYPSGLSRFAIVYTL